MKAAETWSTVALRPNPPRSTGSWAWVHWVLLVEGNSKDLDNGFSVDVVIVPLQLVQIGGVRGTKHVHDVRQCETCTRENVYVAFLVRLLVRYSNSHLCLYKFVAGDWLKTFMTMNQDKQLHVFLKIPTWHSMRR